jgi:hypothetical protein
MSGRNIITDFLAVPGRDSLAVGGKVQQRVRDLMCQRRGLRGDIGLARSDLNFRSLGGACRAILRLGEGVQGKGAAEMMKLGLRRRPPSPASSL